MIKFELAVLNPLLFLIVFSLPTQADTKSVVFHTVREPLLRSYFSDHTLMFQTCPGGLYLGADGKALAYCKRHKNTFALGSWSIANGRLCYDVDWFYEEDGMVKDMNLAKCELDVRADDSGQLWHRWMSESNWHAGLPRKSFKKGYMYQRPIKKARNRLGIW